MPSTAILDQTLAALRDLDHPYRAALAADFGSNIVVLSLPEALALSRPDATGGACVIVATIRSFRVEDREGRKVYEASGALMIISAVSCRGRMRIWKRWEAATGSRFPRWRTCCVCIGPW